MFVTRKSGRVELVGKTSVWQHEETLRFNPETRCYERKPDNSMHVLTARESADEDAGWWSRHGTDITLVEVLELTVVKPRGGL